MASGLLVVAVLQILAQPLGSSIRRGGGTKDAKLISCDVAAKEDYVPSKQATTNNFASGAPVVGPFLRT